MQDFQLVGQQALRRGYTTGTCATAAVIAAADWLLAGVRPREVSLTTPSGVQLHLEVEGIRCTAQSALCAVRKDSGDDPDVTDGIRIFAEVSRAAGDTTIDGGEGVGRVTMPGLARAVGEAAINPAPYAQILRAAQDALARHGCNGGLRIIISAENGAEIAKKTMNARLGIVGGISILGTSGIVEPMSQAALVSTIHTQMDSQHANGVRAVLLCPGNYGMDFLRQTYGLDPTRAVTISNFVGDSLDYAVYKGFASVLLVGHAGKLVKLAAGVMQTHSAFADARQEIFAAHAGLCGAMPDTLRALMESVTVDACLDILDAAHIKTQVMQSIGAKIEQHLKHRVRGALTVECILFTHAHGVVWKSSGADARMAAIVGGQNT